MKFDSKEKMWQQQKAMFKDGQFVQYLTLDKTPANDATCTGFLLGAGNQLFLPSIHVNVTGYCEKKNVFEITETTFKIHRILKKNSSLFWEFPFHK